MRKLKIFVAVLGIFATLAYFTWAIILVYLVTDISDTPNIDIVPELVITAGKAGDQKLKNNTEIADFGSIKAKLESEGKILDTSSGFFTQKIEYPEYIFSVGSLEKLDTPESSFDWKKVLFSAVPSDLLSLNSLRENYFIAASLTVKAIAFGSDDLELVFIQIIDRVDLKAMAYLYKYNSKKKPLIEVVVYPNDKYQQVFKFESKSENDAIVKNRYSDFIKSAEGVILSEKEVEEWYESSKQGGQNL